MLPEKVITKPLMRLRLHEEIVPILQKQIMNGTIKAGTKLPPERELAQTFNVNRTTLREALRKLETLELVEIRQGDGVYAKKYLNSGNLDIIKVAVNLEMRNDIILNLLEVRRYIFPEVAYLAAQRRTATELTELKQAVFEGDLPMLERYLNVQNIIARSTRNLIWVIGLNYFNQFFRDYGPLFFDEPRHAKRCGVFHEDVYDAIKNKKAQAARKVTLEGVLYAEKAMKVVMLG